jgi:hypothetical protein
MAIITIATVGSVACFTPMRPVRCESGHPYHCNDESDVKFCESEVVATEGADCAAMGLVPRSRFCFVTRSRCVRTEYRVKDRDCRVVDYQPLREWSECSAGTQTFIAP